MEVKLVIRNMAVISNDVEVSIKGPPRAVEPILESVKEIAEKFGSGWEII